LTFSPKPALNVAYTRVSTISAFSIDRHRGCDKIGKSSQAKDPNASATIGLLLTATLHALFDNRFLSFDQNGKILISSILPQEERRMLNIDEQLKLSSPKPLSERQKDFLRYHEDKIFEK
jgi:hypothetical protein